MLFRSNGRCPGRIDERAYLGTDKSVPYKDLVKFASWRLLPKIKTPWGVAFFILTKPPLSVTMYIQGADYHVTHYHANKRKRKNTF